MNYILYSSINTNMIFQRSPSLKGGCWQQKQVSIKTLEGEFSVTMWASGADDGESEIGNPEAKFRILK